jgi:hypothetical protein
MKTIKGVAFEEGKALVPLGEYTPEGEGRFSEARDSIQAIHLFRSSDLLQIGMASIDCQLSELTAKPDRSLSDALATGPR